MSYSVKEIYFTLQGEGARAGRSAVFCRFSSCNLWNGKEEDRSSASCWFCDTDFNGTDGPGGGKFARHGDLANAIASRWPDTKQGVPYVVFTGGEPLLQLDTKVLNAMHNLGFESAVETNGTIIAPKGIDWLTVSPKPNSKLRQVSGDELKLVYPQEVSPESLDELDFTHFYLSPRTDSEEEVSKKNTRLAIDYCQKNPKWQLTMQYHKIWGIA